MAAPLHEVEYLASLQRAAWVRQLAESGPGRTAPPIGLLAIDADQRRRQVNRVQVDDQAAGPWRVTLGGPEFPPGQGSNQIPQTALAATVGVPVGFPREWPDVNLTRQSVTCEVVWGLSGAKFRALLDWRLGQSFVVRGSHVTVSVLAPTGITVGALPTGSSGLIAYSAMIAPEESQSKELLPPSLTFDTGAIAVAPGSVTLPIPDFARAVLFHRYNNQADNFTVIAAGDAATAVQHKVAFYVAASGANGGSTFCIWEPLPLPPNARWLRIINDSAVNQASFLVEYLLNLG